MIPVNEPLLNGNEKKYLIECIDSGWISSEGPFVLEFEKRFSEFVGRKHGVAVANGTVAIDAVIQALDISAGDEVIIPSFTIISCVNAIIRAGAIPVPIDCDLSTWNMDVTQIERMITKKTKAIMVVHIYGLPVDMDPVLQLVEKYKLLLIEDAAEAHGQTYKGQACGSFGDVSTFSFYPNKLITTGEGGMVVTNSDDIANRCRKIRNLCFVPEKRFVHEELGSNYRMTNLQAALGVAQLERVNEFIELKRLMGQTYFELLKDIPDIQLPLNVTPYAQNLFWVYGIVLGDEREEDALNIMQRLAKEGVGTRPFFWPIHEQPVLRRLGLFKNLDCPNAMRIATKGFYIPSGLALTREQQIVVSEVLHSVLSA